MPLLEEWISGNNGYLILSMACFLEVMRYLLVEMWFNFKLIRLENVG